MAYATAPDLARALGLVTVDPDTSALFDECLEAAAAEIDSTLAGVVIPEPAPALVKRVNVARAVEHFKMSDAAFGVLGFTEVGAVRTPLDSFTRYEAVLAPLRQEWGIA